MGRRSFSTEFKHEAVRLVRERGMTVSQASRLKREPATIQAERDILKKAIACFASVRRATAPGRTSSLRSGSARALSAVTGRTAAFALRRNCSLARTLIDT